MKIDALPYLTWAVSFAFVMSGVGILSVCRALADRIRHGKQPKLR
jgi:hypothetical protein